MGVPMQAAVLYSHCWLQWLLCAAQRCWLLPSGGLCSAVHPQQSSWAYKHSLLQQDGHEIDEDGRQFGEWCGGADGRRQIACCLRRSAAIMHALMHCVCTLRMLACSRIKIMR
jgi:hypothetical protein